MCARFETTTKAKSLMDRFGLATPPPAANQPEVRPTDTALVLTVPSSGGTVASWKTWGLAAEWSRQPLINARAETLRQTPTFTPLLENRCLVPASAYFEWRHDGRARLKNRIGATTETPLALAGLLQEDRFTLVTCAASEDVRHVHDRMPVIFEAREAEARWLNPDIPFADVAADLRPLPKGGLNAVEEAPPLPRQGDLFS